MRAHSAGQRCKQREHGLYLQLEADPVVLILRRTEHSTAHRCGLFNEGIKIIYN